jgi:hypothetical protein
MEFSNTPPKACAPGSSRQSENALPFETVADQRKQPDFVRPSSPQAINKLHLQHAINPLIWTALKLNLARVAVLAAAHWTISQPVAEYNSETNPLLLEPELVAGSSGVAAHP